jgi:23S rRNA pseudouridine1911/1915/1917 synthase
MADPRESARFHLTPDEVGQTLLAALRRWLPGQSWSALRRLIAARRVVVSGALSLDEGRRLTLGEVVEIVSRPFEPPPRDADVRIAHLDEDFVVVEKPSGMTTLRHPSQRAWPAARKALQPTLDEVVARLLAAAQRDPKGARRRSKSRVYAVHRIDRDTSGLLVFARTPQASESLIGQFAEHTVERVYQAIVAGHPAAQRIETRLVRDRGDGLRGSTTDPAAGKPAITHLRPLEAIGPWSLVECRLETGRTHQIRIHLAEMGHPVCGDRKYVGPFQGNIATDTSGTRRLALHAAQLGFAHPRTGQRLRFEMPLPKDMQSLLTHLRRAKT